MEINLSEWKKGLQKWAENNNSSVKIIKNAPVGSFFNYYTAEILINWSNNIIQFNQNAVDGRILSPSHLIFETKTPININCSLSIYPKSFFAKLLGITKIKTGNKKFDNKFGIYTTNREFATYFFSNEKIQTLFLKNKFLVFNIQKKKSLITFKSMETKFYIESELQKILDDFIFILNLLEKYK